MNRTNIRLGSCCSKIGSGATPKGGKQVYIERGTSLIRSQNVYNLSFSSEGLAHINTEASEKLKSVMVKKSDVLLNITGDSVARICMVPANILPARVNQHVAIIRPDDSILNASYLMYYLASPYMQSYLLNRAAGKGASRNAITKEMIEQLEIPVPPLAEQRRVAGVLAAYDKLIENNRKQIKLLEEAAQRLYKEWFIDLRFPGYETTPIDPATGLPEGWKREPFLSEISFIRGKSYTSEELVDSGARLLINLGNIQPFGGYRTGKEKEFSGNANEEQEVKAHDLIMAVTEQAEGLAGYAALVPTLTKPAVISMDLVKLVPIALPVSYVYASLRFSNLSRSISSFANGAKIKHLKPNELSKVRIVLPSSEPTSHFDDITVSLFEEEDRILQQIAAAQEARDRLLPKLMAVD
ncbi:MAG: restriction endonuclease subunit S [Eggerthellaceae bacterium]|nr:restriction endonuclease subunit S [Eggerthellaceae bacterium]